MSEILRSLNTLKARFTRPSARSEALRIAQERLDKYLDVWVADGRTPGEILVKTADTIIFHTKRLGSTPSLNGALKKAEKELLARGFVRTKK